MVVALALSYRQQNPADRLVLLCGNRVLCMNEVRVKSQVQFFLDDVLRNIGLEHCSYTHRTQAMVCFLLQPLDTSL